MGTVVWTSPQGQTHTTHPGSRLLFPRLCRPTAAVITRDIPGDAQGSETTSRGLMMPRRKQTRTQQRAKDIANQTPPQRTRGRRMHRRTQQTTRRVRPERSGI